jgi:ribosomal protein L28
MPFLSYNQKVENNFMSRVCELTGRKTRTGHNRTHRRGKAGGVTGTWSKKAQATKITWKPNLRKVRLNVDGTVRTLTISMKAYKRIKKFEPHLIAS